MSEQSCTTCAYHGYKRRLGRSVLVCKRYPARTSDIKKCSDYATMRSAVAQAINFFKRSSPK